MSHDDIEDLGLVGVEDDAADEEVYAAEEAAFLGCACDGPHCRYCGCCEHNACPGGCVWALPDVCSACYREAA